MPVDPPPDVNLYTPLGQWQQNPTAKIPKLPFWMEKFWPLNFSLYPLCYIIDYWPNDWSKKEDWQTTRGSRPHVNGRRSRPIFKDFSRTALNKRKKAGQTNPHALCGPRVSIFFLDFYYNTKPWEAQRDFQNAVTRRTTRRSRPIEKSILYRYFSKKGSFLLMVWPAL